MYIYFSYLHCIILYSFVIVWLLWKDQYGSLLTFFLFLYLIIFPTAAVLLPVCNKALNYCDFLSPTAAPTSSLAFRAFTFYIRFDFFFLFDSGREVSMYSVELENWFLFYRAICAVCCGCLILLIRCYNAGRQRESNKCALASHFMGLCELVLIICWVSDRLLLLLPLQFLYYVSWLEHSAMVIKKVSNRQLRPPGIIVNTFFWDLIVFTGL